MGSGLALSSAIADCGVWPWTAELVERPEFPTCTPNTKSFLICRMVQVLMFNILKSPTDE